MKTRRCLSIAGLSFLILTGTLNARAATVHAWEGTIQIPTYLLGSADPNPSFPLVNPHHVYPYTMLDNLTDHLTPKTYRAIYLENAYLKLTILPQLGGHLYSIYDKVDHREVLYRNHVVKYGLIGPRGAWVSGGIEFSFPYAHSMLTVSPVESTLLHNADGSATAIVGALDRVSNMHWEIALTLRPDSARVEQRVTLFNPTPMKHLYLFWANAAVKATPDMQYIYPMRETISDDPYAVVRSWPVWQGVDESWYKNDPSALAIFARQSHRNFFGVYYHKSDWGVVHAANFRQDPGKKVWTWGTAGSGMIWAHILSDHDGPYSEIQSGRFATQGYREFMPPHRVETWTEYWYPVRRLAGGFVQATNRMALNVIYLSRTQNGPAVKLVICPVTDAPNAAMEVSLGSKLLRNVHINLKPLETQSFTLPVPDLDEARKTLKVQIESAQGQPLLAWQAAEPVDGNPDFVPAAGTHLQRITYTSQTPLQELFLHGLFLEKQGRSRAAQKIYQQVLARDPGYIPALLEEAWRSYRAANFPAAESWIARALQRDGENPSAHYAAGVIYRAAGRLTLAQDAFWASIHYGGSPAPSFTELGEIAIRLKNYEQAVSLLQRALSYNSGDALIQSDLAAAERLAGDAAAARQASSEALQKMPLLPYALAERWMDAGSPAQASWAKTIGVDPQNYLAIAAWYHRLGTFSSSDAVLSAALKNLPAQKLSPMIYYFLASNARAEGKADEARSDAQKAAALPCEEVFPNRITDAEVLAEAIAANPGDAHARYALGDFFFAHGRFEDAAHQWFAALGGGFDDPVLLRNLGVYAWRVKNDLPSAAGFYLRAIHFSPNDSRLYSDLDEIYDREGNSAARARLFRQAPPAVMERDTVRARYALFLASQSQFDQALDILMRHSFKPWEGGVGIHNLFVLLNLEKGKAALAAHHSAQAEQAFRSAMEYPENLGVGRPAESPDEEPLYWLGAALKQEGKTAQAQTAWKRAAEEGKNKQNASGIFSALAFEKLGKTEEAQNIFKRCVESSRKPEASFYAYFTAGLAERYSRQPDRARSDFERALKMNPSFWQARLALRDME